MQLMFFSGRPTFGELPKYKFKDGAMPNHVILAVPHSNEAPAALKLKAELEKRLKLEGIPTSSRDFPDIMARGANVRRELPDADNLENQLLSAVLTVEDFLTRARAIFFALHEHENAIYLEVHAQSGNFHDSDEVTGDYGPKRLGKTKLLTVNNLVRDVFNLFSTEKHELILDYLEYACLVALFRGFDLGEYLSELKLLVRELKPLAERIRIVEVPSIEIPLDKTHPNHLVYYPGGIRGSYSAFEDAYCTSTRISAGLSEEDVRMALRLLNVR